MRYHYWSISCRIQRSLQDDREWMAPMLPSREEKYYHTSYKHRKRIYHPECDEVRSEEVSDMGIRKTKTLSNHAKNPISQEKKG